MWLRIWTLTLNLVWCELSLHKKVHTHVQKYTKKEKQRQILAKTKHFLLTYHFINGGIHLNRSRH